LVLWWSLKLLLLVLVKYSFLCLNLLINEKWCHKDKSSLLIVYLHCEISLKIYKILFPYTDIVKQIRLQRSE
jgi:hypothetical protein